MGVSQRSAREVADELRAAVVAERRAEAAKLALVCELADAYRSVLPALDMPGGPRLVSAGGDGTVEVDDFLVQELHPLLGVGPAAAWSLLRQATNLRDRHPKVWALVQSGSIPPWQGRQVAELCQGLGHEAATYVDEKIALPLSCLPWPRARRRLMGLIVAADTEQAAAEVLLARQRRFVQINHTHDGTSWLNARLTTSDAVLLGEVITTISRSIMEDPDYPGSPDEARADAFGVLVTPSASAACPVGPAPATLVVHMDRASVGQLDSVAAVGRVEGSQGLDDIGPVLLEQVRELLGHRRVRVLPVLDLAAEVSVDSYEIPERLRTRVQSGADRHPRHGPRVAGLRGAAPRVPGTDPAGPAPVRGINGSNRAQSSSVNTGDLATQTLGTPPSPSARACLATLATGLGRADALQDSHRGGAGPRGLS